MKVANIVEKMAQEKRMELENLVNVCMKGIGASELDWKNFDVYDASAEIFSKILNNLSIEFLIPIAEEIKDKNEKKVIIICIKANPKEDYIRSVYYNSDTIHYTINISKQTEKFLTAKE